MAKKAPAPRQYRTTADVRELARLARKLRRIESSAQFVCDGQRVTLSLTLENEELKSVFFIHTSLHKKGEGIFANSNTIQNELQRLLDAHLHATLIADSVTVTTSAEGDLSPAGMRGLLCRVWSEASGNDLDEPARPSGKKATLDFAAFMRLVARHADAGKLQRALDMLKEERFQLFAESNDQHLVGIVRSQKKPDLVYSCHLTSRGRYGCCTPDLAECWGMRGQLCKHLLVLIVGLTKSGQIDPGRMAEWIAATARKRPSLHEELLSDTLLKYKGAEAGEIDWRPTETIPEDYFTY
jgi:hypothetical protein